MDNQSILDLITPHARSDGLTETGIEGVKLFRATAAVPCVPVVYQPCVIAILSGSKEAILEGQRYVYGTSKYLCCPTSMPLQAGTPDASAENPLFGVMVTLEQRQLTELTILMERPKAVPTQPPRPENSCSLQLAKWDDNFSEALFRLLRLLENRSDAAILGPARLRELYYAILKGDAGDFARRAFDPGNAIARSIAHLSENMTTSISIDDLADQAGMSRAVFHRKFKQATALSPMQFLKTMRLNDAAMKIAIGQPVNEAALDVGYVSTSQFSREFKRLYGQSPRNWKNEQSLLVQAT